MQRPRVPAQFLLRRVGRAWLALAAIGGLSACKRGEAPPGPEQVVSEFIATMSRVHGDPVEGEHAVSLLWKPARENLKERARRASALSGRELKPGEMLVPSWFSLRVHPEKMESRVSGGWAEVKVYQRGQAPVSVRLALEEGAYKLALELPAPPPITHRKNLDDEL